MAYDLDLLLSLYLLPIAFFALGFAIGQLVTTRRMTKQHNELVNTFVRRMKAMGLPEDRNG